MDTQTWTMHTQGMPYCLQSWNFVNKMPSKYSVFIVNICEKNSNSMWHHLKRCTVLNDNPMGKPPNTAMSHCHHVS